MEEDDVLILTADHGCDPTWPGTDHTREHIPVIVYGQKVPAGSLGLRDSFADIGQSLGVTLVHHQWTTVKTSYVMRQAQVLRGKPPLSTFFCSLEN